MNSNKPFKGVIHNWRKSPTPGYGLGYLIRGVIDFGQELFLDEFGKYRDGDKARASDCRGATGFVIAHDEKTGIIETSSGWYRLQEAYQPRPKDDPSDFDEEKGLAA